MNKRVPKTIQNNEHECIMQMGFLYTDDEDVVSKHVKSLKRIYLCTFLSQYMSLNDNHGIVSYNITEVKIPEDDEMYLINIHYYFKEIE